MSTLKSCPVCDKRFGGATAQKRLNSHCKHSHFGYYRENITPLKDPKPINRAARFGRQTESAVVNKETLLCRMRKKARVEQMDLIRSSPSPDPPCSPQSPQIDPTNPFYVVAHYLHVFVGVTFAELVEFPVLATLIMSLGTELHDVVNGAINTFSQYEIELLARNYHNYRKALQQEEEYPQLLTLYESQAETAREKRSEPELYLDEARLQKRANELYLEYMSHTTGSDGSAQLSDNTPSRSAGDHEGNFENELDWDIVYSAAFGEPDLGDKHAQNYQMPGSTYLTYGPSSPAKLCGSWTLNADDEH